MRVNEKDILNKIKRKNIKLYQVKQIQGNHVPKYDIKLSRLFIK